MTKKLVCTFFALMILLSFAPALTAKADNKLDEIESYKITVDMEKDGSLDITYHIDWMVLDDTSEGPLTWVKVGIPNEYVDNINALSDNISSIDYSNENAGDYVRIDFDKSYYASEIVSFDFSIHEYYMYKLDDDKNICSYSFTPGWFDDIDVKSLTILWNSENVLNSDSAKKESSYLVWTTSLSAGERYSVNVSYNSSAFVLSDQKNEYPSDLPGGGINIEDNSYTSYDNNNDWDSIITIIVIILVVIISIILRILGGGGGYRGGFGTHGFFIGGGGGGHCACAGGCACACACACAGGGRAGCSAKNFYGTIQTDKLKRALLKGKKSI